MPVAMIRDGVRGALGRGLPAVGVMAAVAGALSGCVTYAAPQAGPTAQLRIEQAATLSSAGSQQFHISTVSGEYGPLAVEFTPNGFNQTTELETHIAAGRVVYLTGRTSVWGPFTTTYCVSRVSFVPTAGARYVASHSFTGQMCRYNVIDVSTGRLAEGLQSESLEGLR